MKVDDKASKSVKLPEPKTQGQLVYYTLWFGHNDKHNVYPACIDTSARKAILELPHNNAVSLMDYFFSYAVDIGNKDRISGMADSGKYDCTEMAISSFVKVSTSLLSSPYYQFIMENERLICEDDLTDDMEVGYLPLDKSHVDAWRDAGYTTAKKVIKFLDNDNLINNPKQVVFPTGIGYVMLMSDKQAIEKWRVETERQK